MDDQWTRRVWPPAGQDDGRATADLPPSARWYGTPLPPPRRMPRWAARLLVTLLALVTATAVIGGVTLAILSRGESTPPPVVNDSLAGITYPLPPGWAEGMAAPVTGFTSVAAKGDQATVMARPGEKVDPGDLQMTLIDLSDLYSKLLLRGDTVKVEDDKEVTINGRHGYTRALRAEYRDIVNEPTFLRVTLLTTGTTESTVLLGLAHPDDPRSRAEIDAILAGVR